MNFNCIVCTLKKDNFLLSFYSVKKTLYDSKSSISLATYSRSLQLVQLI